MRDCAQRSVVFLFVFLLLGPVAGAQPEASEAAPSETQALLDDIERLQLEYRELAAQAAKLEGDERSVVVVQMRKRLFEFMSQVEELVANVLEQDGTGPDDARFAEQTRDLVRELDENIQPFADSLHEGAAEFRSKLPDADEALKDDLEGRIRVIEEVLDEFFRFHFKHLGHLEGLGLPADSTRDRLGEELVKRAETLAGRLEFDSQRLNEVQQQAEGSPGDAALGEVVRTTQQLLDAVAVSLRITCDLMDELGLATAEHRQLLISATGEITGDVLNTEVAKGLLQQGADALLQWLDEKGPALLGRLGLFAAILALFWLLGAVTRRAVARFLGRSSVSISELARGIIISISSRVVIGIGFFVALSQLGINVTALVAGLGIAGFIVGFALQDTLGNFASGAMILIYRPFDVGDVIEAGTVMGKVDKMNLVSTTVLTFDNQTLVVPNSKIWGDVIRNVTAQTIRRVDLSFGLAHDTDVIRAEELFAAILSEQPKVLDEPAAIIKLHKLTDSAIEFAVRPWVKREDYWDVYWDLMREVKLRLDREGIQLGVPRREVQLSREASDT